MARNVTKTRARPTAAPTAQSFTDQLIEPLSRLRGQVDRLFDDFPFRIPARFATDAAIAIPALEMTETKKAYKLTAEVPGMESGDIEVSVEDDMLRIAGEKKSERDDEDQGYRISERSYGAFERLIRLPAAADRSGIKAKCRHGLLTLTIPKDGEAAARGHKIAVD